MSVVEEGDEIQSLFDKGLQTCIRITKMRMIGLRTLHIGRMFSVGKHHINRVPVDGDIG